MHMRVLWRNGINGISGTWACSGDGDDGDHTGEMGGDKEFEVEGVSDVAVCSPLTVGISSCSPSSRAADAK